MSATPSTKLARIFNQYFSPLADNFVVVERDDGVLRVMFLVDGVECRTSFDPPYANESALIGIYREIAWEYRYRVYPGLKRRG